jgi:phosphoglycerate dehydrogenase-like enzyme
LTQADVVTLHVPLLSETKNLLGAPELGKLTPTSVLIQGSRGGIVDELRPELEADRVGTMAAPANSRPVAGSVAGS